MISEGRETKKDISRLLLQLQNLTDELDSYENTKDMLPVGPRKVLVVDNDEDILALVSSILVEEGYKIDTASNGSEGSVHCARFQPDLVLLDINMPGMDGFELCKKLRLKERNLYQNANNNANSSIKVPIKHTPILFLTGSAAPEDVKTALNSGGDGYIVKPFKAEDLISRIHMVLKNNA